MAGDIISEGEEENILYDLLINTEWPPETDTQLRGNKKRSSSVIAKAVTGPFRFILHYLWYSPSSSSLPPGLVRLVSKQINWQLVLASNGKLLAVVQDQCVEIRSARDDFGSLVGKCQEDVGTAQVFRRGPGARQGATRGRFVCGHFGPLNPSNRRSVSEARTGRGGSLGPRPRVSAPARQPDLHGRRQPWAAARVVTNGPRPRPAVLGATGQGPSPHWRRVAWSHDCTLLAYADSTGTVRVFDLMGSELFLVPPAVSFPGDFSYAAAGLIFLEYTGSAQWSAELLVITYGGHLKSYLVSVGTTQDFQESHSFSFSPHHSHGIATAVYHPGHRLLLIGGCEAGEEESSKAARCGLTAWRALSGAPHYKQVTSYEDDMASAQRRGFFRIPSLRIFGGQSSEKDGIFRISLSPDGSLLAAIHFSGHLTLWEVPSLRQRAGWAQDLQPGFDEINPEWKNSLEKRKKIKDKEQYYPLLDVSWWSDSAVILARCSGSLTVSSVRTLRNLLGKSCEWFEPSPQLTTAHEGRFLSLECEIKLAQKRLRLESSACEDDEGEDDSDSEDESSARARYFSYVKQGLYYVTEMERFAPPRKRPRTVTKNYRLVCLRSTTPEELYQRKIDSEEYGEALSLAQAYGLDSDLVYQRQWRKSTVSIASIQDYLSKIKKRSWVLHECVERVPENVDAAKELLQYGLKGTDLEALIAIGNGEDGGRFIQPGDLDVEDVPYEDFLSPGEELQRKKETEARKRQELLMKVDFGRLTLEQKELCRSRLKLLCYLDRLATYEEILGGPHAAEQRYDAEFFKKFRNQNILLSALTYARESNVQALDILFTYHGSELLKHRLAVLHNFPETTSPHEYTILLPEASTDETGNLRLIPWDELSHRETDWCEEPECRSVVEPGSQDDDEFLYEEQPELLRFRSADPPVSLLTGWYLSRAEAIDSCSRQVDCALSLVRLAKEREIPGLELLCDDLVTLETLVYETACELSLTLQELQQLKDIDKLRLLMKNSPEERYVKNTYQWMMPFLHRCESQRAGSSSALLREYLVSLSKEDLTLPLKIFQHSKPECQKKIIGDHDQLMSVALECIYSSERDDQLSLCYDVLECLPQRGYGSHSVAEVLEKHGLQKPISFVRSSQNSREEAHQLMVKLTRHTGRKNPPVSENVWKGLLQDLLDMQQNVYSCLEPQTCHQIFTESLLCSSRQENIRLAGQMMHCSSLSQDVPVSLAFRGSRGASHPKVSYSRSVELVLASAREYFDSSTSLTDNCMCLARSCLQLISDCPPDIQEELDLISALSQLEDFGVKILPLQAEQLSPPPAVGRKPPAFSSAFDDVAFVPPAPNVPLVPPPSLGDSGASCPSPRRAQYTGRQPRSAQIRFPNAGSVSAPEPCRDPFGPKSAARHPRVTTVKSQECRKPPPSVLSPPERGPVETNGPPPPPTATAEPLPAEPGGFSACLPEDPVPGSALPDRRRPLLRLVMGRAARLERPMLSPLRPRLTLTPLAAGRSTDLLKRTTAKTMAVISNTTTTTKAVLHAVSDSQWWKASLNYLRPLHGQGPGSALRGPSGGTGALEQQGCNPFYQALFDNPYIDENEEIYTSYDHIPLENFAEVLLRTGKLAETKSEGQTLFPTTEVLIQLAADALPKDMTLALAYLLALPQVLDANKCFEKQSHSALSLQLAAYYYALQIYARLTPCLKDKCHPLYRADPKDLIGLVTQHVTDSREADWPEELERLIAQLRLYNERLTDFTQAQVLSGLGRGVDVSRFSADGQYKKETILGLAETLEDNVYRISLSLAQRYAVPLWEVYMTHLEFLFTDSGLSTKDIASRSEALGLFETLRGDPSAFYDHMTKYVYPSVAGTDLPRLLFFFTLLEECGCAELVRASIKPETHVRLLKKLKAVATGLDYRKLTDDDADPLLALQPVLTSQNVLSVSKLLSRLPLGPRGPLSSSAVHAAWLGKLFWKGDPQVLKRQPQSDQDFLHAYDACAKYLDRLVPSDAVAFLDGVTFSPEAARLLAVETRREVTKRALRAVRQLSERARKKGGEESGQLPESSPACFEQAVAHLQHSLDHLESLRHPFIQSLRSSEEEPLQQYSRVYDLSRSDREQVHDLAVTMLTDGRPLGDVQQLLEVAVGPLGLSPKRVAQDAIQRVVSALSGGDEHSLTGGRDPLVVLEGIVSSVHADVQNGGRAVSSDDILSWLRPFCGDPSLPVRGRMEALQILERAFPLGEQDSRLLLLYRSQAVLEPCWPHRQLEMADVESEEVRDGLFAELLLSSSTWEETQHLALLLQAWPPPSPPPPSGPDTDAAAESPWVRLTRAILSLRGTDGEGGVDLGAEVLGMCRSLQPTGHKLPVECVGQISGLLLAQPGLVLPALKLMAETGDEQLLTRALAQMRGVDKVDESNCDEELLSLLLDAGLLIGCVGTLFYPRLVDHLLAHHQERGWDVEGMCREMQASGRTAEAGSLLLTLRGTHPGQFTFNSALAAVRRWL
ncbi:NBAS subunit of NRZ tethering complex [Conger conger]|uniref:NBAS subunit of NRZ tethering complex n=1 Tax=Conger conger TaxID=82655 RepID=UPI002A5AA34E|nr:NBAS subunit of NRZ tethering complex [Conger conger]